MDLITSGLAATNEKFNNILKKVNTTTEAMKSSIQIDASVASEAIGSQLSALEGELRGLVPTGFSLPNINLQSQLSSLSGIANFDQASSLLSGITSNFGSALSASGFNLDSLVSDAKSAVAAGKSLSFDIPNFELPAAGGDALQKAIAVKLPKDDPVEEVPAKIQENLKQSAVKIAAANSVISVSSTPPTEDTKQIKITTESSNITQQGITSKVTTAKNAVVTTTTSGGSTTISRKNFSENGFVTKQIRVTEYIHVQDVDDAEMSFELSSKPIRIGILKGFDQTTKRSKTIRSFPTRRTDKFDTFVVNGKKITISNNIGIDYDEFGENSFGKNYGYPDQTMFVVSYYTLSNYDPDYKTDEAKV
jgi:hypothetical protein|tara:strand:+ start:406 stop:1494 length:1089 start_codon:yes stop_codon:yes gene_type:complete